MSFVVGALVFAKLKGYRPWPAKITQIDLVSGKVSVFFYGTYEKGVLKNDKHVWLFSATTKERFGKVSNANTAANKLFLKAIKELEEKPEVAFQKQEPIQLSQISTSPTTLNRDRSHRKIFVQVKDTDEFIEIDLDKKRPLKFASLHECQEWEKSNLKEAMKFKKMVEQGNFVPEEVISKLEKKPCLSVKEKAVYDKWKILQKQRGEKIRWLKSEMRLAEIERDFRHCLNPTSPDLLKCCQLLDELSNQHFMISPLMFKKQPQVMDTLEKMTHYVGPKQGMELDDLVQKVRTKSKSMYLKFQSSFDTPMNISFKDFFASELEKFNTHCQGLTTEEIRFMTHLK